jgi:hypothetical protein
VGKQRRCPDCGEPYLWFQTRCLACNIDGVDCPFCKRTVSLTGVSCPNCFQPVSDDDRAKAKTAKARQLQRQARLGGILFLVVIAVVLLPVSLLLRELGSTEVSPTIPQQAPPPSMRPATVSPPLSPPAPAVPAPTSDTALDDSVLEAMTRKAAESMGIKVRSVRITDGRANGGERVLIILFTSATADRPDFGELTKVLECGYALNQHGQGVPVDSTIALAGIADDRVLCTVCASVSDAGRMARGEVTPQEYLTTWTWGPGWKPNGR